MKTPRARALAFGAVASVILVAGLLLLGEDPDGTASREPSPSPDTGAGSPSHLRHLPDPVPDLVAMIKAERPVAIAGTSAGRDKARSGVLRAIRQRQSQGDRREAMRLYRVLAGKYRGTPEAAEALFAVVRWRVPRHAGRSAAPADLAPIGEVALRLAEENPDHHLTVRTLDMYLSESLKAMGLEYLHSSRGLYWSGKAKLASVPYAPSSEEWQRIFRCAAILSGRHPGDERGPKCLLGVAGALTPSPRAKATVTGLYRLVSEWPDAWDLRFRAYKALHDQAMDRGEVVRAGEIALRAATACAGRTSPLLRRQPTDAAPGSRPDTPWQKTLAEGVPSDGRILLRRPKWTEGARLVFRVSELKRQGSSDEWHPERSTSQGGRRDLVAYLLRRGPGDVFVAVASAGSIPRGSVHPFHHRGNRLYLPLLGRPDTVCVHGTSLLFLPRFPVREGVGIFPCDGISLARQEARTVGDRVVVRILAGRKTVWRQTWAPDELWWDEAELEYESFEYQEAQIPGLYDVDPGWGLGTHVRRIRRTTETDGQGLPSALELERMACERLHPLSVNAELRPAILSQLPKLFTGEKLARLQASWQGKPDPSMSRKADMEREEFRIVESLLAQRDASGALAKLDARKTWPTHHDLALLLRAKALLVLGKPREGAEILRWTPRRGPVACAEAHLLESRAWEECGEHGRALSAVHGLLRDHVGSTEAAAARTTMRRLNRHEGRLNEARERDPYFEFCLRSLWHPRTGHGEPYGVRVDRSDGAAVLSVWDHNRRRWRISPDGQELDPPEIVNSPRPGQRRWGHASARIEICRKGEAVYVREADRLVAEDPDGKEIWRHTVVSKFPDDVGQHSRGLPRLTDPTMIHCPGGDRIVCGIGHRTVMIGMGIYYRPLGGGLLVVDLAGKLVYQKEAGYCEALAAVSRKGRSPMVVGLFLKRDLSAKRRELKGEWFVAAFDAWTGEGLWKTTVLNREERYRQWRHAKPLLLLSGNTGSRRIAVSLGDLTLLDLEGYQVGAKEGVEAQEVADIDRDGIEEIIGCRRKSHYDRAGRLYILDPSGETRWESPPGRWSVCCIEDLDGDGWEELLALREYPCRAVAIFGKFPTER